ncbi:YhfG family protein [Stutzerimonas stutzeri]|uniref:YhfG family protein n=1 Tax=Stutzerimonas stutzeri subgroup TaxID=578833 RepID=UPI0009B7C1DB|nr:DUF2559 domain-containing protein [Stutzerimonas stutzeri]WOF79940.1 YhfG family protein [Pseudomonas sp. FeN3W]
MSDIFLEAKRAYYARVRRSSYIASLRLVGFDVTPADADRELPTRQAALEALQNAGQERDTCGTPAQKQKG